MSISAIGKFSAVQGFSVAERVSTMGRETVSKANEIKNIDNISSRHFELEKTENNGQSFSSFLLNALNSANNIVHESQELSQAFIVDPSSVDVHDVTISLSKAYMAVSLTKNVVDEAIKAYKEITNLR